MANKRNVITSEDAAGGRQSLKLTSAVTFYEPRLRDCAVRVAFDVKLNAARPTRLDLQLRDWRSDPFKALTYIAFQPDGSIDANGILTRVPPGTWMHVELTFELRPQAPGFGSYKLRITPADGTPVERTLPLADATCRELTWLGLVMEETSTGTAYVDNLVCEPLLAASPAQPAPKP